MEGINVVAVVVADCFGIFLALTMLVVRIWNKSNNKKESFILRIMLFTSILGCLADMGAGISDGQPGGFMHFLDYLCNFYLYLSQVIFGTIFFILLTVHCADGKMPKWQKYIVIALDAIGAVGLIVNIFAPFVFGVGSDNLYYRIDVGYYLYTAIEFFFVIDSIVFYFIYRKKENYSIYFPVWQFILPIVVGIIAQSLFYGISTINPSMVIGICGVVLGLYNESEAEMMALKQHEIDTTIIVQQKEKLELQQKELAKALKAAESSSNAKTAFLNNMSHDIRTPMNAILGYTDIAIRHANEPDTISDSLNKIKTSGKHLLNLINDILEMSRIESGKLKLSNGPVDIRELIDGVKKMSMVLSIPKSIDFKINVGDIKDPFVLVDELHLNEVLINLVSNAVKYTPDGGKVYFNVSQISEPINGVAQFRFEVIDNGIGMSKEFQKSLFESFSREQSSTVNKIEGTGLGLAIVKKIVDLAKGKITVESELDKGSTFVVELPIKLMSDEEKEKFIAAQRKKELNLQEVNLKGKRVLLVEDNEMNREIAKDLLSEAGLDYDVAEDGAIALKKIKEFGADSFDVILMDIQMPIMNGYEATKAIRELPDGNKIPIIALSANAFKEDIEKSLEAGMNAHVAKPINIKILFDTMQKLLKN